jgi:hypothetical protein
MKTKISRFMISRPVCFRLCSQIYVEKSSVYAVLVTIILSVCISHLIKYATYFMKFSMVVCNPCVTREIQSELYHISNVSLFYRKLCS